MDISVVIPTYGRAAKLAQCMRALAAQDLDQSRYEILIGLDGPDQQSALMAADVWTDERQESLRIIECPRSGANATRNCLLGLARGTYAVFVNDDVIPGPDFLKTHLGEQEAIAQSGTPAARHGGALLCGSAPWRIFDNDTLFDRIVRDTSMIFFYDQMYEPKQPGEDEAAPPVPRFPPDHDWGFRHWWTLNASAPIEIIREIGGFLKVPLGYGYDDIELAYRIQERFNIPVLFRPAARAVHDHRYLPAEVLDREHRLGQSAWHYANLNPPFAQQVFGRDIRTKDELAYSREFVSREAGLMARLEPVFLHNPEIPASAAAGPHGADIVTLAFQQHLALKRWYWRKGLLAAAEA